MISWSPEFPTVTPQDLIVFIEQGFQQWENGDILCGSMRLGGSSSNFALVEVRRDENDDNSYEIKIKYHDGQIRILKIRDGRLFSRLFDNHLQRYSNEEELDQQSTEKLVLDLNDRVVWGDGPEFNRYGLLKVEDISSHFIDILGLGFLSDKEKKRLTKFRWFSIDGGRIVVQMLKEPPQEIKLLQLIDFDDTLMATTTWHEAEFRKILNFFRPFTDELSIEQIRAIYNLSKVKVPVKAENEPRYTPALNLLLLDHLLSCINKDLTLEQSMRNVKSKRDQLIASLWQYGDEWLISELKKINTQLLNVFFANSPSEFLYQDAVTDLLSAYEDGKQVVINVIVTRGAIEGPLGQVYKINSSGISESGISEGVTLVVYTNDLKKDLIGVLRKLFPQISRCLQIRVYDDSPSEIRTYHEEVVGGENPNCLVELIRVRHPGAKRQNDEGPFSPAVRVGLEGSTTYDHYFSTGSDQLTN